MSRPAANQEFVRVCSLAELEPYKAKTIEIGDRFVVLVRFDDGIYCIDDVCTHDGGTLGDGELEGHNIVCSRHGAKFDLRTGEAVAMPATEPTVRHETKIDGENVLIKINDQ